MTLIDLTHTYDAVMPVYPGDTPPQWIQKASLEHDGYVHFQLTASMHIGTHIDAPAHFISNGKVLSDIPLERFTGRGVLINARGKQTIDVDVLTGIDIQKGDVVLIDTGFAEQFGKEKYFEDFPEMTEAFAKRLVEFQVHMIGLDNPSPERDQPFPCHKILLGAEILILENLTNMHELPAVDLFEVMAFPPKFAFDGAPVRVVAKIN